MARIRISTPFEFNEVCFRVGVFSSVFPFRLFRFLKWNLLFSVENRLCRRNHSGRESRMESSDNGNKFVHNRSVTYSLLANGISYSDRFSKASMPIYLFPARIISLARFLHFFGFPISFSLFRQRTERCGQPPIIIC